MEICPTPTMLIVSLESLTDMQKSLFEKYEYPEGVEAAYSPMGKMLNIKGSPDKLYKVLLDLSYTFDIEIV